MYSDKAISTKAQDELGYDAFAARLVKPLLNWVGGESLVVGLYGAWGSGKSSVMNLLEGHLAATKDTDGPHAIPVRFNPWLYRDTESLLLSFFGTLSAATKNRGDLSQEDRKALGETFAELGESLGPIFSLTESWGGWLKFAGLGMKRVLQLGESNILEKKAKADAQLLKIGKAAPGHRVVVLIDDLDRIEPSEVRTTLKLVKLLADLPYVSYVLAMDQLRVAELLDRSREGESGLAYLEKIIQLPVYLPDPSPTILKGLVMRSLEEVVGEDPFSRKGRVGEWSLSYGSTLGKRVSTLRDRARLINNLRFLLHGGTTRLEVHPTDAVLLSMMQTFYPEAYQRVRRNRTLLTDELGLDDLVLRYAGLNEDRGRIRRELLYRVITGARGIDDDAKFTEFVKDSSTTENDFLLIKDLVQYLFPYVFRGERRSEERRAIDRRDNRIVSPDRFDRYFSLQPPVDEVSDIAIDQIVGILSSSGGGHDTGGDTTVQQVFAHWMTEGRLNRSVVTKIVDRLPGAEVDLCIGAGRAALALQAHLVVDDLLSLVHSAIHALSSLVMRENSEVARAAMNKLAGEIIVSTENPFIAVLIADQYSEERRDLAFDEVARKDNAALGADRMAAFVLRGGDVFQGQALQEATNVLWRWRDLLVRTGRDPAELQTYIAQLLEHSPHNLPRILAMAAGWGTGPALIGVQSRKEVAASLEWIGGAKRLLLLAKEYAGRADQQDQFGLVSQFLELFDLPEESEPYTFPPK